MAAGHRQRYELAARWCHPGYVVNDVACGIGYGAMAFDRVQYHGYDLPGIADDRYEVVNGTTRFHPCDLDDPTWHPQDVADVTCCFETLEHVKDPPALAHVLAENTRHFILVSVPTQPTMADNPTHLHDFTVEDIPPLFGWSMVMRWTQPEELAHVWLLACR